MFMCLMQLGEQYYTTYVALFNRFTFIKEKRAFLLPAEAVRRQTHGNEKWKTNVNKALQYPFSCYFLALSAIAH